MAFIASFTSSSLNGCTIASIFSSQTVSPFLSTETRTQLECHHHLWTSAEAKRSKSRDHGTRLPNAEDQGSYKVNLNYLLTKLSLRVYPLTQRQLDAKFHQGTVGFICARTLPSTKEA